MSYASLWRCLKCGGKTDKPQILRGRRGGWVVGTICEQCSKVNFHSKWANWMTEVERIRLEWREIFGINIESVRRRSTTIPKELKPLDAHLEFLKKRRAGWEPGSERMAAESEGTQQAAVTTYTTPINWHTTPTPNPVDATLNQEPNGREKTMGIKKSEVFPKKYLKVDDLRGRRITAIIERVVLEEIGDEEKPVVYFEDNSLKPLVLNLTNWSMIEEIAGSEDTDKWSGVKIVLYPTKTDFQGKRVPCIRIDYPKQAAKPTREPGEDEEAA